MRNRRQFLIESGAIAAAFAASRLSFAQSAAAPAPGGAKPAAATRPLKILVLGGTGMIGPFFVKGAVARGHQVTTFNRGKSAPNEFAGLQVELLYGDRATGDLKSLEGRDWDAVVDLWPSQPKYVRQALEVVADHCDHYLFVSTVSVYAPMTQAKTDESWPVLKLPEHADPEKTPLTNATYGQLKALCEQKAEEMMPGQVTVIRPGLIVGPEDDSDRFVYWPVRVADGGEVLAPGTPDDPMQVIDVRDLAAFLLHCLEQSKVGVMNATGPVSGGIGIGKVLEACKEASGSDATFTWVPDEFLDEQKISAWSELPAWISPRRGAGIGQVSIDRAVAAGLTFRPLVDTARDTVKWWRATSKGGPLRAGLAREKEKAALAAWHAKAAAGGGAKKGS